MCRQVVFSTVLIVMMCSDVWAEITAQDKESHRFVDLSHVYRNGMITYPDLTGYRQDIAWNGPWKDSRTFIYMNDIKMSEHTGTHMDAPAYVINGGETSDKIPMERLMAPGVVVDVVEKAEENPDYELTEQDLEEFEERHGRIPNGAAIFMRTDWSRKYEDRMRFLGTTSQDVRLAHFPGVGREAAEWLVRERAPRIVGVETLSLDKGQSKDFPVHKILLGNKVVGMEVVANLDQMPPTGSWVYALPIKVHRGSGGPTRLFAEINSSNSRQHIMSLLTQTLCSITTAVFLFTWR